jgi:hypothetical protein
MVSDGHMHGCDSALTKLIEDFPRPIVILEGIDDHLKSLKKNKAILEIIG